MGIEANFSSQAGNQDDPSNSISSHGNWKLEMESGGKNLAADTGRACRSCSLYETRSWTMLPCLVCATVLCAGLGLVAAPAAEQLLGGRAACLATKVKASLISAPSRGVVFPALTMAGGMGVRWTTRHERASRAWQAASSPILARVGADTVAAMPECSS